MEKMKSYFVSFAVVTSRQNKVAASKKGIVTKHIAKWVVLCFWLFWGDQNGTSGARIKILRPLFNTNTPPKTPI